MKNHKNTCIQSIFVTVEVLAKSDEIFHLRCYKNTNTERIHWQPQKYHQPVYIDDFWSHFRLLTLKNHGVTYIQSLWVLYQVLAKSNGIFHIQCYKDTKIKSIYRRPQKYHQPVYIDDCWSHSSLLTMKNHVNTYIQRLWVLDQVLEKSDGILHIECCKNTNNERIHRQLQKYHQPVYIDDCWSHFRLLTMKNHVNTYIQS
jgi:hypothetical protein